MVSSHKNLKPGDLVRIIVSENTSGRFLDCTFKTGLILSCETGYVNDPCTLLTCDGIEHPFWFSVFDHGAKDWD